MDQISRADTQADPPPPSLTIELNQWAGGDSDALNRLLPLVYSELERRACDNIRRHGFGGNRTFSPADLVHEVYHRLVKTSPHGFVSRSSFYAFASRIMRFILVDYARKNYRAERVADFHAGQVEAAPGEPELLRVEEWLDKLALANAEAAQVIEMRYYGGLELTEISTILGTSYSTVKRRFAFGRAWLRDKMQR